MWSRSQGSRSKSRVKVNGFRSRSQCGNFHIPPNIREMLSTVRVTGVKVKGRSSRPQGKGYSCKMETLPNQLVGGVIHRCSHGLEKKVTLPKIPRVGFFAYSKSST